MVECMGFLDVDRSMDKWMEVERGGRGCVRASNFENDRDESDGGVCEAELRGEVG